MEKPGSDGKASVYNAGDPGLIPGSGRSAGEGNGNPLQYYCLENPMDRGAWLPTAVFSMPGESPWTEVPGGLQSMGYQRVGHD